MKYDGQIDILNECNSQSLLLRQVPSGSMVLELGPGPGRMTQYLAEELNCCVYAVERDQEFCNEAAKWAHKTINADIDEPTWTEQLDERSFDCIILADVLEHLVEPWKALTRVRSLLKDDGVLLVSLPNAAHSAVILNLLNDNLPYKETGLLDQTHLRFFTHTTARTLLEDTGFFIETEDATYRPVQQTLLFDALPKRAQQASSQFQNRKYANVFQFVFKARKREPEQDYPPPSSSIRHWTDYELLEKTTNPMLFVDSGEGFMAGSLLLEHIRKDKTLCYDLANYSDYKRLRFDPCEQPCVVQINSASLITPDGAEHPLELSSSNGTTLASRVIEFTHDDPNLIFDVHQQFQAITSATFHINVAFLSIQSEPSELGAVRLAAIARANSDSTLQGREKQSDNAGVGQMGGCSTTIPAALPGRLGYRDSLERPGRQEEMLRLLLNRCNDLSAENQGMKECLEHTTVKTIIFLLRRAKILASILLFPICLLGYFIFALITIWRAPRRMAKIIKILWGGCPLLWSAKKMRLETEHPGITRPVDIGVMMSLERRYRELNIIAGDSDAKNIRVNFLFPSLVPDLTFGGYIAALRFLEKLVEQGHAVRLIICDDARLTQQKLLASWKHNPRWWSLFSQCEFHNINGLPFEVCKNDRFIAYCGWVGLYAHQLAKATSDERFVFFIQEYETVFHPNDSLRAALEAVYNLPHVPMFNTTVLNDYFKKERLGIYSPDYQGQPGAQAFPFAHAIAKLPSPSLEDLLERKTHKVLFYARPERHAARNLFALGMIGLKRAIERGVFPGQWEFWGIGTLVDSYKLDLGLGHTLNIIPRVPQDEYEQFILGFDVGISYMMAPHPSILPFEMLSAGLVVVTNEYKYRDAQFFEEISKNIVTCKMSPDSMADALEIAVQKALDPQARLRDATLECNHSWDEAFSPEFIQGLIREISE